MLVCDSCGTEYQTETSQQLCECGEPLRFDYMFGKVHKEKDNVWTRYSEFFPFSFKKTRSLDEGNTPLIKSSNLSEKYQIEAYLKNETVNPTWSFKDRGTHLSILRAIDLGYEKIGTVSTGNMAASVASYGKKNSLDVLVLLSSKVTDKKIDQIGIYSPKMIVLDGDYGELYYQSLSLKRDDIYFTNSNSPSRIEGYKSIAYEMIEEETPDYILIPTSSGGLFRGIAKGLIELKKVGILDEIPTLVSVQAEGCSPIKEAMETGKDEVKKWEHPKTEAKAIANPYPPGGNQVIKILNRFDGISESVSDDEIISARQELAHEGIFCQPASAVTLAGLKKLREKGIIEANSKVFMIITGSGLKSQLDNAERNKFDLKKGKGKDLESSLEEFF